ncbi:MAG: nitrite reductase large subunit NirB [Betaproteobacteria bacterium]|nr:nitrite reductase large subunit NirB [Betaproteobacteria bacterium]MCH9848948.1 nitrite reductase large subunit NirB [Betaproteobacteria bacterium]
MQKMKLVVIGNGMAGMRVVEELLKISPDLYDITVFGDEPYPNYNRIMLSPVLANEQTIDDIILNTREWYAENNITLHTNARVNKIDRVKRVAIAEDGTTAEYDRLLIATGSKPFMPPIPGKDLEGVLGYRDIKDTNDMIEAAKKYKHAVVIGGGLLGLEAANGLKIQGMDVTVIHRNEWLLEKQLDKAAGLMLQKSLEAKGLKFHLNTNTDTIIGNADGRVSAIRFKEGFEIPADLVVLTVGILPNYALAESAGIHCDKGIVVNDTMQTFDPRVYAVGECVNHRGISYGLVAPLFEMAKVCATHLANFGIGSYKGSVTSTKLKVTGIDLFSAGDFTGGDDTEEIVLHDAVGGVYKKLVIRDDKIIGGVLYGDTADGAWYFQMLRDGKPIHEIRDHLMFGQDSLGNTGHQGQDKAAAMTDEMEVCGCNGVCKGTIVKSIQADGLFTLDDVKKKTKAGSSCGSCTGLVEQILASTLGGGYAPPSTAKSICACTDHNHEEVREEVRKHKYLTIPDAMKGMEWKTPNGCATCRPALNYYLISTWPHEATDDPQSRFINERVHANIQKDGTYSVIPRMYGGVTNPDQLRKIADVADKYKVPMVKLTGGQRIDLLGVKKEDLTNMWADLDMPSGYAYGKSIRTVKTCVGSEFCRFGTQNSTQLGIDIEKAFDHMWAPHKVKFAVSACPRNCAESGIKDVGIIGVDSGWELYVGGNGGIKTEAGQFLCKVKTAEEVLEYSGAFIQIYREEARYLDRTVHWIERVGLEYVKQRVLEDAEGRKAAHERLLYALQGAVDPWAERVAKRDEHKEFETIEI